VQHTGVIPVNPTELVDPWGAAGGPDLIIIVFQKSMARPHGVRCSVGEQLIVDDGLAASVSWLSQKVTAFIGVSR